MKTQASTAFGYNLPPLLFADKVVIVRQPDGSIEPAEGPMPTKQHPVVFSANGLDSFSFPIDPFVSVSQRNAVVRRHVAKGAIRGTIKERWTQDDAEITISGLLIGNKEYITENLSLLTRYCNLAAPIQVHCRLLNELQIYDIVIEQYDLPHTKGHTNQAFSIKAYSDDVYDLLIAL
jgi:hypothetical protein